MKSMNVPPHHKYLIGIDPGTLTGISVFDNDYKQVLVLDTVMIHQALEEVRHWHKTYESVMVRIENAATWIPFKGTTRQESNKKLKGAGSISRDCSIWEDTMEDWGIPYEMVKLQGVIKKLTPDQFRLYTGVTAMSSSHARDACMLVYNRPSIRPHEQDALQHHQPQRCRTRSGK